jgi:hypothetical protein
MKITALLESSQDILLEQQMRRNRWLVESVTSDMTPLQRKVVEGIYRDLTPLIEASIDPAKVKELFGEVEKQAAASGGNRTALGKGVDTAKKANDVVNNVGKWLQNTAPVQNFDQKFEDLKKKATEKFPEISSKIGQMGQWAKENPGKTAAIIGVLTTIAALGTGPVGGAIAGQILRGSAELLKGEKLSTAVGKGIKTAAYGFIAGKTFELIGDALSGGINVVKDTLVPGAIRGNFTRIFDQVGGELGDRFASFEIKDLVGNPNDVNPIMALANDAANAWQAGDYQTAKTLWGQVQDGVEAMYTPEYLAQLASDQSTRELIAGGAKAVAGLADFMGATAQGAIAAGVGEKGKEGEQPQGEQGAAPPAKQESKLYQTRPLSEGQVYLLFDRVVMTNVRMINEGIVVTNRLNEGPMDFLKKAAGKAVSKISSFGKNLTSKVTADKLLSAWKKAGSPTDVGELNSFLSVQGLAPEVIKASFQTMNIKPPAAGSDAEPEQPGQDAGTATQDQAADQPEPPASDQSQGSTTRSDQPTKDKPEKGQEVEFDGKKYQWLGAQWAEVNPKTGKAGKVAEKGIVKTLNDLAGVGKSQDKPADAQSQPTGDQPARDAAGTTEKPAAPAGTIGLAQQGSDRGSATGSSTAPAGDQAAPSTAVSANDQAAPTAAKAAKAAPAAGKVDAISLAKMIKQLKPEVINAVKKLLTSREAQRAL